MKLIIGLGNPEEKYRSTRHNVGFWVLSRYGEAKGLSFQPKSKFKACVTEYAVGDDKVILAKQTTYYNFSGEVARALADFYKIDPKDILIIHDELMLPFGTLRTRIGGSDAGNNGIKSINDHLGQGTARLRIGVYNERRDQMDDADFVLSSFTKTESDQFETALPMIFSLIDTFIDGTFDATTIKHL
ncbi:MAG: aminoacyl-tRNA hydrolase [Candidatus Saccharimonas sp.]|nr:aminoacyl-tRNA hydrolase [Candidatus Saccharimonas sp.]